jgi:hypothetical protein
MPEKTAVETTFDSALQHAINADKLAQSDPARAASELAKAMQALIKGTQTQLQAIEDGIDTLAGQRGSR